MCPGKRRVAAGGEGDSIDWQGVIYEAILNLLYSSFLFYLKEERKRKSRLIISEGISEYPSSLFTPGATFRVGEL